MSECKRGGRAPVAVVVVSWNAARFLRDCLSALLGLERPPVETVLVDNGSHDDSLRIARDAFPAVRRIELGENVGFCRANNVGIAATSAPFVLVLNPDTRLGPAFLEQLLPAFVDPRVGIVAGKLLRFDGHTLDSCGQLLGRSRRPVDRGYGRRDRGQFDHDGPVFGACGAAALYRRAMLEAVALGPGDYFDPAFFAFYEDLDVAWRARRAGWRAEYRHRAVGLHARGGTSTRHRRLARISALLGRSSDVRYHVVKNRYLTILRNDTLRGWIRNLPFVLGRDLATLLLLAVVAPSVLARLWKNRSVFRSALRERRLDGTRRAAQLVRAETGEEPTRARGSKARALGPGSTGHDGR